MKYMFTAKIWFVKTSTRIVKDELRVVKLNPVISNPDTYWACKVLSQLRINSLLFLDDETFYHTHIPVSSITIFTATVIKSINIANFLSSIIHMTKNKDKVSLTYQAC